MPSSPATEYNEAGSRHSRPNIAFNFVTFPKEEHSHRKTAVHYFFSLLFPQGTIAIGPNYCGTRMMRPRPVPCCDNKNCLNAM